VTHLSNAQKTCRWLVVWNIWIIFPYNIIYIYIHIGNNDPNWLSYFFRGWNHQPDFFI
jgi:hypothetical protein